MVLFTLINLRFLAGQLVRYGLFGSVLVVLPLVGWAQGRAAVRGTVSTGAGAPLEYVTVTLHRAADSVVVKTEFTDGKGAFRLEVAEGRYLVSAAQVGLGRYWSPVVALSAAAETALPPIQLTSQVTTLKEVTVTGRRPLYERLADRTVVHVAESPLAAGSTTLDVLGRAPNVTVDGNDNLALRGRQGLLVVLDGKRVPLAGTELADYLRALPADQIQSIELITNPPASYDAQGGAGVIAINLKKDQRLGTNGSVNASYGRSKYGKFTSGLALNYRRKNLNLFGTYAYTDRRYFTQLDFERQFAATPTLAAASSLQNNYLLRELRSHSGKVGLDVSLSKRTTLGASVTALASQTASHTDSHSQFFDRAGASTGRYASTTDQDLARPSGAANLNWRHAFADSATARSLSADADYARYRTTRRLDLNTYFEAPSQPTNLLHGDQRSNLSIGALKVDYSHPLPHRTRLEAGAKATQVVSDNHVGYTNTRDGSTTFLPDISYQFRYRENVNAAYVSLRGAAARTTLQAGLRAEQTNTRADSAGATLRERHYAQLFPSLLVQRALSKSHALALAVARRVDRPTYTQVNPLRTYVDATSFRSGNPYLVASTSYNFELTHTYKGKFSTALAYAITDQPIVNVVQPAGGSRVVVNREVNLTTQHFYTLTLTAPLDVAKWWTLYANGILYYNRYVGSLSSTALDRGRLACNLTLNNSFTLPLGWTAELNGLYESREVVGFAVLQNRGQVALGLQKSLWHKQGTLRLSATDIFYTTPIRTTSTYDNFSDSSYQRSDLRVFTAALTYRFGNSKVAAARRRAAGADDELRRAGEQ